jgi:hypothetical protein
MALLLLHKPLLSVQLFTMTYTNSFHSGVAVGSTIGHALGGFFGGGSSAPVEHQGSETQNTMYEQPRVCGEQVTQFKSCMDTNQGDLNICGWYLEQLKACQQSASKY